MLFAKCVNYMRKLISCRHTFLIRSELGCKNGEAPLENISQMVVATAHISA